MASATFDLDATLKKLSVACAEQKLTASAEKNIRTWLEAPHYAKYAPLVAAQIEEGRWQELDDAFWTIIPFGTGGRRGQMYPIGSNAINERTIGESAQGLADYVSEQVPRPWSCAIAYDTRHRSREFAELCAGIMVAAGFQVYFLDEIRSTPELSFLVRYKHCSCGIMVTASHNPPSDNAVKVYWSTGGQLLPPHDRGVIERVMRVKEIKVADFASSVTAGTIDCCCHEVDAAYLSQLRHHSFPGSRDLKIIYSPLHGVGVTAAVPAMKDDGFSDLEVYAPHAAPDGDFPNVPDHVSNPENAAVFESMMDRAREVGADLVLATDPDCDRVGCAAPRTTDSSGPWSTLTGNQIGALLTDYVCAQHQRQATLTADHYVITTLVTTRLVGRIAASYGLKTYDNNLVGFKWICGVMDDVGPDKFVFGTEESHGYLVGDYARDKDGAVACMLLAELAAACKANGQSLHQRLDQLYLQHGCHAERLLTQRMEGSEGMTAMQSLMQKFRADPPQALAGMPVVAVRDYQANTITRWDAPPAPLVGPTGNLVILDLEEPGNYAAARPSGTEPKVKFYLFGYQSVASLEALDDAKRQLVQRLDALQADLQAFAASVT